MGLTAQKENKMKKYLNKEKTINYFIVERKSKNKHPFVVVGEDINKVCGLEMARFETKELAIKAIERFLK